jgi:hypothetical protein
VSQTQLTAKSVIELPKDCIAPPQRAKGRSLTLRRPGRHTRSRGDTGGTFTEPASKRYGVFAVEAQACRAGTDFICFRNIVICHISRSDSVS